MSRIIIVGHVTITERLEEAMREVGVLLIAFSPLDFALNRHRRGDVNALLIFFCLGTSLFTGALVSERRRADPPFRPPWFLLLFLAFAVIIMTMALKRIIWG